MKPVDCFTLEGQTQDQPVLCAACLERTHGLELCDDKWSPFSGIPREFQVNQYLSIHSTTPEAQTPDHQGSMRSLFSMVKTYGIPWFSHQFIADLLNWCLWMFNDVHSLQIWYLIGFDSSSFPQFRTLNVCEGRVWSSLHALQTAHANHKWPQPTDSHQ